MLLADLSLEEAEVSGDGYEGAPSRLGMEVVIEVSGVPAFRGGGKESGRV